MGQSKSTVEPSGVALMPPEAVQVCIELPLSHLESEIPGIALAAQLYLHRLEDLAISYVQSQLRRYDLHDRFECEIIDKGYIKQKDGFVRRLIVCAKRFAPEKEQSK